MCKTQNFWMVSLPKTCENGKDKKMKLTFLAITAISNINYVSKRNVFAYYNNFDLK